MFDPRESDDHEAAERRIAAGPGMRDFLRRERRAHGPQERSAALDRLAEEYLLRGGGNLAERALDAMPPDDDLDLRLQRAALRAAIDAMSGTDPSDRIASIEDEIDDASENTVAAAHLRAGMALYFYGDSARSEAYLARSAWLYAQLGDLSLAARVSFARYAVARHLGHDFETALTHLEEARETARVAGDFAFKYCCNVSMYTLATAGGDWDAAKDARDRIRRSAHRDAVYDGVQLHLGEALERGAAGDYPRMELLLGQAGAYVTSSTERAQIEALRALAFVAQDRNDKAREAASMAASRTDARCREHLLPHLATAEGIAATLAARARVLAGDAYRGNRTLDARARFDDPAGWLARALRYEGAGVRADAEAPLLAGIRGYLLTARRVERTERERRAATPESLALLTPAERDILSGVAAGKFNAEIARERDTTLNAVERRLVSAYKKLGARNRSEAIAKFTGFAFSE